MIESALLDRDDGGLSTDWCVAGLLKEVAVKPKGSSSAAVSLKLYRSGWLVVVGLSAWFYSLYKMLSPHWCEEALRMEGSGSGRQVCATSDAELVTGVGRK